MEKPRILYAHQEMCPYTTETPLARIARQQPQFSQEQRYDVRIFMPKYGSVNERKNQLHEVIRLSGMNLVINDIDHPLIVKVASLSEAKMQVYFLDNDDFFLNRDHLDANEKPYDDTDAKLIFFGRGVVETTAKLSWSPDLIHCNGWMTSLLPLYIRRFYKNNPMYNTAKIVLSLYNESFKGKINKKLLQKLAFDKIPQRDLDRYEDATYLTLMKAAIELADGVIIAEAGVDPELIAHVKRTKTTIMTKKNDETFFADCNKFYSKILAKL